MLTCIHAAITFIKHNIISKQKIHNKEGDRTTVSKAVKLSIKLTNIKI